MEILLILGVIAVVPLVYFFSLGRAAEARDKTKAVLTELRVRDSQLDELMQKFSASPDDRHVHHAILSLLVGFPELADSVYANALDAVEQTGGSPPTKVFALKVGRLSYGDGESTYALDTLDKPFSVEIEHAIQNDIAARIHG